MRRDKEKFKEEKGINGRFECGAPKCCEVLSSNAVKFPNVH